MSGLLFVTAPEADHKLINRLLLHLNDWEYENNDRYKLVTTRSIQALGEEPYEGTSVAIMTATSVPVDRDLVNEWAGASMADVEAFCLALDASGIEGLNTHIPVVLDSDGVGDKTCVLAQRVIDWEADSFRYKDQFNKARLPWYQTYLAWVNLDIANMGWDEMMLEDGVEGGEGLWWTYKITDPWVHISEENRSMRDEAISQLESEGRA